MGDVTLLEDYGERQWVLGEDNVYLASIFRVGAERAGAR
jgi:hypothetical protein